MKLDTTMLEVNIGHAKKGDTEAAHKIIKMLESYISKGAPIPDILSSYVVESERKIDEGMTHEKAYNLSKRPGNQYHRDTILKEINIARHVYNIQNYLKSTDKPDMAYLAFYKQPSEDAMEHIKNNFNPTIESICDWLSDDELIPHITSRSAKNSKNREFMRSDNIRKIYDRWVDGIKATEEQ